MTNKEMIDAGIPLWLVDQLNKCREALEGTGVTIDDIIDHIIELEKEVQELEEALVHVLNKEDS